jgi:IgA Peptidase M64/von Willebrand factor type A domain
MGASDGYVIGLTKRLDHGPASARFNFVVVAEGFQASEMPKFHNEVNKIIDKLFNTKPLDEMWCAINVYSLDVASTESGADEPSGGECTGSGVTRATYFDATFCTGGIQRALSVDAGLVENTVSGYLPEYDVIVVVVNSMTYGGLGQGAVCTCSLGFSPITGKGGIEIPIHEMGHAAFQLADEYAYGSGNTYTGGEPASPDITANADKNTIKWKDLIAPTTNVPTQSNQDCSQEDTNPSPVPAGTVGAFEGAGYYHCGLFRPEFNCQMRELGNPFCAVCNRQIKQTLQPYMAPITVTLATPTIEFKDVPEGIGGVGVTTYRAAIFEVGSCASLTLQATQPTGGFGLPLGNVEVVPPAASSEGKIWVSYTSTTAGATANGQMTVHSVETNEDFVVQIKANTVPRLKSAVVLVLDHSGSMSEDAGDGSTKVSKLRPAAKTFVDAMLAGDGLGLVRFDDTAQIVEQVDDVAVNGGTVKIKIDGPDFDPAGDTSIGHGLQKGSDALTSAPGSYAVKAMAVLTDGMENTAPFMNQVSISANTFGIGFGTPANVDVGKLEILTGTHQGYLLITGALTQGQLFRLQKYFVQILAGVTNAEIIVDPEGVLFPGTAQKVPFVVTEPDYGLDVILLARDPRAVDFWLETPSGTLIDPAVANTEPNIQLVRTPQVSYYRMGLPALPADPLGSHGGKWNAVLQVGKTVDVKEVAAQAARLQMPYSLIVHSYSSLQFRTAITQSGYAPGSQLMLTATLTEYTVPVKERATVRAEMSRPDGTSKVVSMKEEEPGRFTAATVEALAGLYRFRVRASGLTFRERPFTREQTLTAVIGAFGTGDPSGASDLCKLLKCLLASKAVQPKLVETLQAHGIEWKALADCLRMQCSNIRTKG